MSHSTDRPASEIEREVEHTRSEVSGTLDALRQKLSPQQIVDQFAEQAMDYLRGSGGTQFASNLGSQVRDNPLPVALIGAGVAWLLMSGNRSSSPRVGYDSTRHDHERMSGSDRYAAGFGTPDQHSPSRGLMDQAGDLASRSRVRVLDTADSLREGASGAASAVGDAASRAGDALGHTASRVGDAVSDTVARIGDTASDLASRASGALSGAGSTAGMYGRSTQQAARGLMGDAGRGLDRLSAEQPLLFGALGLALGAALGAVLPKTEAENELMGEARDALAAQAGLKAQEVYEQARGIAGEGIGRVTEAASEAYSEVRERVQTEGVAGAGEALGRAVENVANATGEAVRHVSEEARRAAEQAAASGTTRAT